MTAGYKSRVRIRFIADLATVWVEWTATICPTVCRWSHTIWCQIASCALGYSIVKVAFFFFSAGIHYGQTIILLRVGCKLSAGTLVTDQSLIDHG